MARKRARRGKKSRGNLPPRKKNAGRLVKGRGKPAPKKGAAKPVPKSAGPMQAKPKPQSPCEAWKKSKTGKSCTGVVGLNEILDGGLGANSISIIIGGPGSGKSIIASQFIEHGIKSHNEPAVLLSLEQGGEKHVEYMKRLGMDLQKHVQNKKLIILTYSPNEMQDLIKGSGGMIKDAVDSIGAKRFVIDSLSSLTSFYKEDYEKRRAVSNFFSSLRSWGVTVLATVESSDTSFERKFQVEEFLADTVLVLRQQYEGRVRRNYISAEKLCGSKNLGVIFNYRLSGDGMSVEYDAGLIGGGD